MEMSIYRSSLCQIYVGICVYIEIGKNIEEKNVEI